VLLYLKGGPPTPDMFDMKPHAPDGVGGEFQPIATCSPGMAVLDRSGRPMPVAHGGEPVREILA
jgi:hypothetical protein